MKKLDKIHLYTVKTLWEISTIIGGFDVRMLYVSPHTQKLSGLLLQSDKTNKCNEAIAVQLTMLLWATKVCSVEGVNIVYKSMYMIWCIML